MMNLRRHSGVGRGPDHWIPAFAGKTALVILFFVTAVYAAPTASTPGAGSGPATDEMEVQIKGQFKGRLLVKRVVAPITMNLEKLQDFPEDPSQKIIFAPLNISQSSEFNARSEIKAHAAFFPWLGPIAEPPFLLMYPPQSPNLQVQSWAFEVLNPQGQVIYRQRGVNGMPDELAWDGKDSETKFAVVGRLYSAQLTYTDKEEKRTVVQGGHVLMPVIAYSSDGPQTIEVSLARLFKPGKADISMEGMLVLSKIYERFRERALNKIHIRISQKQDDLAAQREVALVQAMSKALHIREEAIKHDHTLEPDVRGEIAVIWAKGKGDK